MSTSRRALPVAQRACKACSLKSFHTMPRGAAKAKQSPKLVQKVAKSPGAPVPGSVVRVRKPINPEEALPPISLLNSGSKAGALDIPPEKALALLRQYQERAQRPTTGWEQKLCDDHGTSPSTLYLLGKILNRCPSNAQRSLATRVIHSASTLGIKSATFELIESSILKGTLNLEEFSAPLKRLAILAKQKQDSQAIALLGRVMLSLRKENEALEFFRSATQSGFDFEGASEALVQEGRILLSKRDKEGAEAAFKKAALELDDPSGYFYLSQMQPSGSSEQEVYLLKAASSGNVEACHNLGSLEMGRIKETPKGWEPIPDYDIAKEWFQVAAAEGFGLSMLNLAMICKAQGDIDQGEMWLGKAEELPGIREEVGRVRAQWGNQRIEIL